MVGLVDWLLGRRKAISWGPNGPAANDAEATPEWATVGIDYLIGYSDGRPPIMSEEEESYERAIGIIEDEFLCGRFRAMEVLEAIQEALASGD